MTSLRWVLIIGFVGVLSLLSTLGISVTLFGKSVAQNSSMDSSQAPSENFASQNVQPPAGEPSVAQPSSDFEEPFAVNDPQVGQVPPPPQEALKDLPVGDGSTASSPGSESGTSSGDTYSPNELPPLPADAYVYQKEGKRDPFEPFRRVRAAMAGGAQVTDISALERWEIDKIKIIAVLWDTKNPRAVVMTPDAATHTVARGTKIGRNFGVIKDIREGEIVVAEKIFIDGKSKTEIQVIELK